MLGGNIKGVSENGDQIMKMEGGHLESALPSNTTVIRKDMKGNELKDESGNPILPKDDVPYSGNYTWVRQTKNSDGDVILEEAFRKTGKHTFFPRNWTPEQVCEAVIQAYGNRTVVKVNEDSIVAIGYYMKGTDKEIKITLYLDKTDNLIVNAHPEFAQ